MKQTRTRANAAAGIALLLFVGACRTPDAPLRSLTEARRHAADLSVQFANAADAANRAVMADTDDVSVAFAREAAAATASIQTQVDALAPLLKELDYSKETALLDEFKNRFAEYRALDKTLLDLAVENTNIKAQRLSFGQSQEAVNALRDALDGVTAAGGGESKWHAVALAATAIAAVRQMQVLQASHIAEADDTAMTRIEKEMSMEEASARTALASLAALVDVPGRGRVEVAIRSLDRFKMLNDEIVALSRRNTNVRSLALSLGQKRMLTAGCEESLRALQDALGSRMLAGTR